MSSSGNTIFTNGSGHHVTVNRVEPAGAVGAVAAGPAAGASDGSADDLKFASNVKFVPGHTRLPSFEPDRLIFPPLSETQEEE